jgi:hypothetical protein
VSTDTFDSAATKMSISKGSGDFYVILRELDQRNSDAMELCKE